MAQKCPACGSMDNISIGAWNFKCLTCGVKSEFSDKPFISNADRAEKAAPSAPAKKAAKKAS